MKLSIIIPVYNLEKYIAYTLKSVTSIRFSYSYEILVINDGSADKSEDVIKEFMKENPQIRLVTINNGGVSNARNVGLQMAQGEYISFVDGDDQVEPDFFETAVKELDAGGYDFVQGNMLLLGETGIQYRQNLSTEVIEDKETMLRKLCGTHKIILNNAWGKVFRATLATSVEFDTSIRIGEDLKYVFDIINEATKIKLLSCDAYRYYMRNTSATHSSNDEGRLDEIAVYRYMEENIEQEDIRSGVEYWELLKWLSLYVKNIQGKNIAEKYWQEIKHFDMKNARKNLTTTELIKIELVRYVPFLSSRLILLKDEFRKKIRKQF